MNDQSPSERVIAPDAVQFSSALGGFHHGTLIVVVVQRAAPGGLRVRAARVRREDEGLLHEMVHLGLVLLARPFSG